MTDTDLLVLWTSTLRRIEPGEADDWRFEGFANGHHLPLGFLWRCHIVHTPTGTQWESGGREHGIVTHLLRLGKVYVLRPM